MKGLPYGKYKFSCLLDTHGILPSYKGSTFRGVFGLALKKVVCALKRQECETCLLNKRCVYALVFETPIALDPPEGLRVSVPPHPFVIEPPITHQMEFKAGERFDCSLILFGHVNASIPYFIYAFDQIGVIGVGRKIDGKRAGFTLKTVSLNGTKIYSDTDEKIRQGDFVDTLKIGDLTGYSDDSFWVKVIMETPLRLKYDNRLKSDLPFHVLVRAMLRRISSLFICYANGEPDMDYKGLLARAEHIKIVDSSLKWHTWERYSNRLKQRMPLGGMIGSITYQGPLGEYLPLMDLCSKTHIGKNTSFGLGKIRPELVS